MEKPNISGDAIIFTGEYLHTNSAKTAHGLLRYTKRFNIKGIIDSYSAKKKLSDVVENLNADVDIYGSLEDYLKINEKPKFVIIGIATKGGILDEKYYDFFISCLKNEIGIVNGLHQPLKKVPILNQIANENNVEIVDIRKPKSFENLCFWSGKIKEVNSLKLAVLGLDCAIGKRTTATLLIQKLREKNINAHMIYTGQTGWLQGYNYGFIFDATPNDFVSGEIENAMYQCWENENPDVMIIEGQSGLRNPSGPCGLEFIFSGNLDGVILQHIPSRKKFKGFESYPAEIPSLQDEIELIKMLGTKVIGVSLNHADLELSQIHPIKKQCESTTKLPVAYPIIDDMENIVDTIIKLINDRKS